MKFCNQCGETLSINIPAGDNRERHVCKSCSTVHYQNPRIIAGCIPSHEDSILLCRRAIDPRHGLWTLPAGFMENDETIAEGCARETWEEALAKVDNLQLYTVISVPSVNQVHTLMLGDLVDDEFSAGPESLEVELFTEEEIPWDELAFTAVRMTLERYFEDRKTGVFPVHNLEIERW